MKRLIAVGTMMIFAASLSWGTSSAPTTPSTTTPKGHGGTPAFAKEGPCKKILDACNAAGYYYGGYKVGKGEYVNCMDPILKGQSVAGVTVTADEVSACSAHKAQRTSQKPAGGAAPAATTTPAAAH